MKERIINIKEKKRKKGTKKLDFFYQEYGTKGEKNC